MEAITGFDVLGAARHAHGTPVVSLSRCAMPGPGGADPRRLAPSTHRCRCRSARRA